MQTLHFKHKPSGPDWALNDARRLPRNSGRLGMFSNSVFPNCARNCALRATMKYAPPPTTVVPVAGLTDRRTWLPGGRHHCLEHRVWDHAGKRAPGGCTIGFSAYLPARMGPHILTARLSSEACFTRAPRVNLLGSSQLKSRAQAAQGRVLQRDGATVHLGKITHDRQAKTGARRGFVGAHSPL
jgi:hypothetical protein